MRKVVDCEYDVKGELTICTLTLESGFRVVGTSGTINPAFYDAELGKEIAHRKAMDKLMGHEAYHTLETHYAQTNEEEE